MSYKKIFLNLIFIIFLLFNSGRVVLAFVPLDTSIEVKANSNLGAIPELLYPNVWLIPSDFTNGNQYIANDFFVKNNVKIIQLSMMELKQSVDFKDYKARIIANTKDNILIPLLKKSKAKIMLGNWPSTMSVWLSSWGNDKRAYTQLDSSIALNAPPKCLLERCTQWSEITCYNQSCKDITQQQFTTNGYVDGWKSVVTALLDHFYTTLSLKNLAYYVGHEQNKDWIGKEVEFYDMYKSSVKAVQDFNRIKIANILIGGTGVWAALAEKGACDPVHYNELGLSLCKSIIGWSIDDEKCKDPSLKLSEKKAIGCEPMNKNLLEYSRKNNLPVNFLNYHQFGVPPFSHVSTVEKYKKWLTQFFFLSTTPLYPADWTVWADDYPADYIDTEYNPSYFIKSLYEMNKAGIKWHSYDFEVQNFELEKSVFLQRGENAQFLGTWAVFTRNQIIKPIYNAFRLLSLWGGKDDIAPVLANKRLSVTTPDYKPFSDDYLAIMASNNNKSPSLYTTSSNAITRVLLSNYVPAIPKDIKAYTLHAGQNCMISKGYTKDQLEEIKEKIGEIISQNKNLSSKNIEKAAAYYSVLETIINTSSFTNPAGLETVKEDLKACLPSVKNKADELDFYLHNPRNVNLAINSLPAAYYIINKYFLDKDHSNPCRYNKKTEIAPSNTPCGINGEIDRKVALAKQEAKQAGTQAAIKYLKDRGYTDIQIQKLKEIVSFCQRDKACILNEITKQCSFFSLGGVCDINSLTTDLKNVYGLYRKIHQQILIYDSVNSISKINNQEGVKLYKEQSNRQQLFGGGYNERFQLPPNSVMMVEIVQNSAPIIH